MRSRAGGFRLRDFIVENFDDLLTRLDAAQHRFTECFLFDSRNEVFCDGELDIGLEESQAHFPEGIGDVFFADLSVATELLERFLEVAGEIGKHETRGGSRRDRISENGTSENGEWAGFRTSRDQSEPREAFLVTGVDGAAVSSFSRAALLPGDVASEDK